MHMTYVVELYDLCGPVFLTCVVQFREVERQTLEKARVYDPSGPVL